MSKRLSLCLFVLMFVAAACLCSNGDNGGTSTVDTVTVTQTVRSVGTVASERQTVEHGPTASTLKQITGSEPLFNGDSMRVIKGGVGLLDFRNNLKLRLFNESQLSGIEAESAPGIPLIARMLLERGGFTGHLTQPGGRATFHTPGGAEINVYGTDFFTVYNEGTGLTVAGNFGGAMEVSSAGITVPLPSGAFVLVASGQQPEKPQEPIPFDLDTFERMSIEQESPIAVVEETLLDQKGPEIILLGIDPQELLVSSECPGQPNTTRITVEVFDINGIEQVVAQWNQHELEKTVVMERIDERTFAADIGPVSEPYNGIEDQLVIIITAWDMLGNKNMVGPFYVKVSYCIG